MDRSSRQKISKATVVLNDTIDQLDLIAIYRTFHTKTAEYTFFAGVHGTVSRTDYMLGPQTSLNKFKVTELISSIFSNHSGMKLEINFRNKNGKGTNTWKLKKNANKKPLGQ